MRFRGGNFFEFALVMLTLRDRDFRDFLLSGPRVEIKKWLDDYNAFPQSITLREPQKPYYAEKPEKPTLPRSTEGDLKMAVIIALGVVFCISGIIGMIKGHPVWGIFFILIGLWQCVSQKKSTW